MITPLIRLPCSCSVFGILLATLLSQPTGSADVWKEAQHGFADNKGIKIHFATVGDGPLVVMIHGFPDFWYTWRHQMDALKNDFKVVAIDQRGYNKSAQPASPEAYDMPHLISDVEAVIRHHGEEKATIIGHDWGGAVAWQFAFSHPRMTRNLVILNLPHPNGFIRELTRNHVQRSNSAYAQTFKKGSASDSDVFFGRAMTPENLAGWITAPDIRQRYIAAFEKSSFDSMLQIYKRNYPDLPKLNTAIPQNAVVLKCPTLMFHGLEDQALHSDGLNNTWDWIDAEFTLVTIPEAGHFVQNDAAEKVSKTLKWWLMDHR